jgi:hypothetical protein
VGRAYTGLAEVVRRIAEAGTKDEALASAGEAAKELCLQLQREIGDLREQVQALNHDLKQSRQEFHETDKQAAVLAERLRSSEAQLELYSIVDWILNFLFALGGALIGIGVSWPDIEKDLRRFVIIVGLACLVAPISFKFLRWVRNPSRSK